MQAVRWRSCLPRFCFFVFSRASDKSWIFLRKNALYKNNCLQISKKHKKWQIAEGGSRPLVSMPPKKQRTPARDGASRGIFIKDEKNHILRLMSELIDLRMDSPNPILQRCAPQRGALVLSFLCPKKTKDTREGWCFARDIHQR